MAAVASIVLANGEAVPVNHTFAPAIVTSSLSEFHDRSGGIVAGFGRISLGLRGPTQGSDAYKETIKVVVPTLEQTSPSTATGIQPAPTRAYDCLAVVDMVFPTRSTLAERKNLFAYLKNLLAKSESTLLVENFEMPY
jgi:hypothetical protein